MGNALSNTNDTKTKPKQPNVNTVGNKCTTFNESGYFLYRLIRAIPLLYTCLKNFLKSVLRLCQTHASGNNRQDYPPLKIRIEKSISSPKRISEKPPKAL